MTDCGRCTEYEYWQDTDDEGRAIAPPVEMCCRGYELYPEQCNDFKDAWKGDDIE